MHTRTGSYLLIMLLALGLAGCPPPEFSDVPVIAFKSIRTLPLSDKDSLVISILYRDGTGDLGLGPNDTGAPFDAEPYVYNYHITAYKRLGRNDQGNVNYEPVQFPTPGFTFNGRFPVLKPDGQAGPIEGDLDYSMPIEFPQDLTNQRYILPGDTLRFDIFIYDRGGQRGRQNPNRSNTITTGEVVVLKR